MRLNSILLVGDPALREPASVASQTDRALAADHEALTTALLEFRAFHGWGRAIAATQLGIHKRIIAMEFEGGVRILQNPEIVWQSDVRAEIWDDCMSLPSVAVKLTRSESISVEGVDQAFRPVHLTRLNFWDSELLQHEIDHLNGKLFVDYLEEPSRLVSREWLVRSKAPLGSSRQRGGH